MLLSKFGTFSDVRTNEHRTRFLLRAVFGATHFIVLFLSKQWPVSRRMVATACIGFSFGHLLVGRGGIGVALAATVTAAKHWTVLSDTKPQLRWDGALPEPDRSTTPSRSNLQRADRRTRRVLFWLLHGTRLVCLFLFFNPSGSRTARLPPEVVRAHARADFHMQKKPVTRRIYLCEQNETCIAIMLLILSGIL